MTKQEFDKLKVGDSVYMYLSGRKDRIMGTEVISIDRIFGKIQAICSSRPKSYKYFKMNVSGKHLAMVNCYVGSYKL